MTDRETSTRFPAFRHGKRDGNRTTHFNQITCVKFYGKIALAKNQKREASPSLGEPMPDYRQITDDR